MSEIEGLIAGANRLADMCLEQRPFGGAVQVRNAFTFQSVYVRPDGDRFQFVAQWVRIIGGDFTIDEEILATADTPNDLPLFSVGRDFSMAPRPSMR